MFWPAAVVVALAPTPITLATGPPGGLYRLPVEHQAVPCVAVSSDGAVANILRVEAGTSTFGLSQTDLAYAAYHGEGPFAATGPSPALRSLIALHPEAFIVFAAGHPNGLALEATTGCRARLVRVAGPSIERLMATHSYYVASVIPGGLYPGNPRDVATFGTLAVLLTTSRQPDALAYAMVKAIFDNFADFRRLHPVLATLQPENLVPSEAVIPIHPGALRYYRETGLRR